MKKKRKQKEDSSFYRIERKKGSEKRLRFLDVRQIDF